MADDKNGRENQAQNAERRQRDREVAEQRRRHDEPEPPFPATELEGVEAALEAIEFPATPDEIVAAIGDQTLESPGGSYQLSELLPEADAESFESPTEVTGRVEQPSIAAAMKRIVEAAAPLQNESLGRSQRDAYERTLAEVAAIDPVDDDDGVTVITEWILERIEDRGRLPGSRDVRRQAAKYCRSGGYEVRDDEWLGV